MQNMPSGSASAPYFCFYCWFRFVFLGGRAKDELLVTMVYLSQVSSGTQLSTDSQERMSSPHQGWTEAYRYIYIRTYIIDYIRLQVNCRYSYNQCFLPSLFLSFYYSFIYFSLFLDVESYEWPPQHFIYLISSLPLSYGSLEPIIVLITAGHELYLSWPFLFRISQFDS